MAAPQRVVIGVDVGVAHLAFAAVAADAPHALLDVAVVSIAAASGDDTVGAAIARLPAVLDGVAMLGDDARVARYVIEQQPASNPRMRIVSHAVQTYIATRHRGAAPRIAFQSARAKMRSAAALLGEPQLIGGGGAAPTTYGARKQAAVRAMTGYADVSDRARFVIAALAKRDDAADAFLHALHAATKLTNPPRNRRPRATKAAAALAL